MSERIGQRDINPGGRTGRRSQRDSALPVLAETRTAASNMSTLSFFEDIAQLIVGSRVEASDRDLREQKAFRGLIAEWRSTVQVRRTPCLHRFRLSHLLLITFLQSR